MSARKSAPRVSPPGTAFSPGKALIGMKVARKFIEKRRHGFIRGVVVDEPVASSWTTATRMRSGAKPST